MNIADLDRPMLKLILRTSQGFTSPGSPIIKKPANPGPPRPRPVGHAFSHHVRGAAGLASFSEASKIEGKTRFNSMDDQAEALWLALNTSEGLRKYRDLDPSPPHHVQKFDAEIDRLFTIVAPLPGQGQGSVSFSEFDQRRAGIFKTAIFVKMEARARDGRAYLHIQTFFPKLSPGQISLIVQRRGG